MNTEHVSSWRVFSVALLHILLQQGGGIGHPGRVIAIYVKDAIICFFMSLKNKLTVLPKKLHCVEEHLTGLKAPG